MLYIGFKMLDIYRDQIEDPKKVKACNPKQHIPQVNRSKINTLNSNVLHAEHKQDINCKELVLQSHCSNKKASNTVVIFVDGPQKQQYLHGLKHDITITPYSIVVIILPDSKGHQGTIHVFKAIGRSYWWSKLHQDVVKYTNKCGICAKSLATIAKSSEKHLETSQIPVAVLAIPSIGLVPVRSKGNRWVLTAICLYTSYVFAFQ